ncbi:MAG: acyltransferase family protein [Lachnospiraceae bacterium]|nr:acyltransferase family protein [Lachnospiraceae bacterium]
MKQAIKSGSETLSISKEASSAIKGVLILLVVLGHNSLLCNEWNGSVPVERYFYWRWLYTFHVYCFFILPFIYNRKPYTKGNIIKYAVRLLYPYLWICALCAIINVYVLRNPFAGWYELLRAVLYGSELLLDNTIGFNFPWFLPAMFSLLLLKDVYYSNGKIVRVILVGIGIVLWFIVLHGDMKFSTLGTFMPLSIVSAFRVFPICLLTVWLAERISFSFISCCLTAIGFLFLSFLLCVAQTCNAQLWKMIFYFVMPIAAFLFLLQICDFLSKSVLLIRLGRNSLQIYLYHVIIFNALLLFVKQFHFTPTVIWGLVVYCMTLFFAEIMAKFINSNKFFKNVLYPSK